MKNTDEKIKSKPRKGKIFICVLAAVLAVLILLISFGKPMNIPDWNDVFAFFGIYADLGDEISLSFIDVGSADACYVKCGDKNVLIDAGTSLCGDRLTAYLERSGCTHFDAVIISHTDSDHIGSAADIIEKFGTDALYMHNASTAETPESSEYKRLGDSLKKHSVNVVDPRIPFQIKIGQMTFKFISPLSDFENANDNSLAVMIYYKDKRFLFTGDMSEKVEKNLINSDTDLNADVLKIAHHGSSTSSCDEFLKAVSPQISVVNVGRNDIGLPDYYTMARINSLSKSLYRTDRDSTVVITYDNGEFKVKTHA